MKKWVLLLIFTSLSTFAAHCPKGLLKLSGYESEFDTIVFDPAKISIADQIKALSHGENTLVEITDLMGNKEKGWVFHLSKSRDSFTFLPAGKHSHHEGVNYYMEDIQSIKDLGLRNLGGLPSQKSEVKSNPRSNHPSHFEAGDSFDLTNLEKILPGSQVSITSQSSKKYSGTYVGVSGPQTIKKSPGPVLFLENLRNPRQPDEFNLSRFASGTVVSAPKVEGTDLEFEGALIRHFGNSPAEHLAQIKKSGISFSPTKTIMTPDGSAVNLRTTEAFDIGGERKAVLGLVQTKGQIPVLRLFVRSNSHGSYRAVPMINSLGHGNLHMDKGNQEVGLEVIPEIDKILVKQEEIPLPPLSKVQTKALEIGAVRFNFKNFDGAAAKKSSDYLSNKLDTVSLMQDKEGHLPEENQVDFNNLAMTYTKEDSLLGKIEVLVYYSRDKALRYIFHRTKTPPIFARIASIQNTAGGVTDYAVPKVAINAESKTVTLYEHASQHPDGSYQILGRDGVRQTIKATAPAHPKFPNYLSMWKYVRQIPEIQQAYKAWGIPLPD